MSYLADRVGSVLIELADCLCREIKKREMPDPCFCGVFPGDAAPLVYCNACEGGQAWVRLVAVGAPEQEFALNNCMGLMVVQVEMGMVFGWLPMDEDGEPKDMAASLAAPDRQISEMDAMCTVLTCCDLSIQEKASGLSYTPVGPDGTCLGGVWTASVPVI